MNTKGKLIGLKMFAVVSSEGELLGPPCQDKKLAVILYFRGIGWSGPHKALLEKWRLRRDTAKRIIRPVFLSFSIPAKQK